MRSSVFAVAFAVCYTALVCEGHSYKFGSIIPANLFNTKWSYNQTYAKKHNLYGPDDWKSGWPFCDATLSGSQQSPINIDTDKVGVSHAGVLPLTFQTDSCDTSIRNIGATLSATPADIAKCKSTFTTASGTVYKFYEAHVHWHNYYNHRGSEHRVDGQAEAVEVQLVHYNSKFVSIDEAFHDGNVGDIAVLAVRYTVAPSGENATEVPEFGKFIAGTLDTLEFMDLSTSAVFDAGKMNPYDLIGSALPRKDLPMFHYNGSLTVPSCDSIVSWYIVQQTAMISKSQMQQLRRFKHVNKTTYEQKSLGFEIDANVRPLVPLNDREIVAWPIIVPTNSSSDSGPDSQVDSSSNGNNTGLSTGAIIGIAVAGGVALVAVSVLITALVCVRSRKGYEGIPAEGINASA